MAATAATGTAGDSTRPRRKMLMQSDVPAYSAIEARAVAEALRDQYGKQPATPLQVAVAMNIKPSSSAFKMITGAAVAYGFTDAAAQAEQIGLTDLGRRAVAPLFEGDDVVALREAILKPRVTREFLDKYDGNRIPNRSIAMNVLESMGVPTDKTERALDMILTNARTADFIETVKGSEYISLSKAPSRPPQPDDSFDEVSDDLADVVDIGKAGNATSDVSTGAHAATAPPIVDPPAERNKKVFITHGRNKEIVGQLKEILTFGKFEPVVSVENETLAKPIPDKVLDDMRACGAGIVHVGVEETLLDSGGEQRKIINSNVLIEIGAALALYGRRLVLLVEDGTKLPSNLQGLYEARYSGEKLDHDATMKLLRAFNEFDK
jgi:predicted nucleotide-binding protein